MNLIDIAVSVRKSENVLDRLRVAASSRVEPMRDTEDELDRLRLEDFERTELHKLRLEARAVLPFTEPSSFLQLLCHSTISDVLSLVHRRPKRKPGQVQDIRWHDDSSWYFKFWINLQPWLNWLLQYVTSLLYGTFRHPLRALDLLRLDWLSWFALFVLGPCLFVFSTMLGLLQTTSPQVARWLDNLGTSLM